MTVENDKNPNIRVGEEAVMAWDHLQAVKDEADELRVRQDAQRLVDAEGFPATQDPPVRTLAEIARDPTPAPPWRIADWWPHGSRVLLAAQYKAGKTVLTANVLRSLADGDRFLGVADVTPVRDGTIALFDFEMGEAMLRELLLRQGIRDQDRIVQVLFRGCTGQFGILDPDVRARWARLLRDRQARVLVLDCLRPILDALRMDEHHDTGLLLTAIDALAREAGITEMWIVHHMGHAGERSRGDSRLRDWPDVEVRLVRKDEDPTSVRFVSAYGRTVNVPESQLHHDPATDRLTMVGGSRRTAALREVLDAVLAKLDEQMLPQGQRALARDLADVASRDQVYAALKLGRRTGVLTVEPGPRGATLYGRA